MPMEKPTKEQIDSMIEECIKAVNEGKVLERSKILEYQRLLGNIANTRKITLSKRHQFSTLSHWLPQGILIDALGHKLITNPKHKKFIEQWKTLIEIETALKALTHVSRGFNEFAGKIQGKPITERWKIFRELSGLDFYCLYRLGNRQLETEQRLEIAIREGKPIIEQEKLRKKIERIGEEYYEKKRKLISEMRLRIGYRFAQPNTRQRLLEALRNPRDELTKRDLEKLMRNIEAFDRKVKPRLIRYGKARLR